MARSAWLLVFALFASACATSNQSKPKDTDSGGSLTEKLVSQAREGKAEEAENRGGLSEPFDLTDAALIASGFDSPANLKRARANFERLFGPLVAQLEGVSPPASRGERLLSVLHQRSGLLGEYDARATTLGDILDRRLYNCVSASVVYNILAARLGLKVAAQLLPTHARTLLELERSIVVETTSAHGFDPSPEELERILAAVAGPRDSDDARAIVPDSGVKVDTLVLIGTIYINRASIAQEQGQLERAERLFARGEAFAKTEAMRQVLRDQRAALMSQLGADDILSNDPKRFRRAYRTLKAAILLRPVESRIRSAVLQNLRAAAERVINLEADQAEQAGQGGQQAIERLTQDALSHGMSEADQAGLRAFALSEVARLKIKSSEYEGAVEAIERALAEPLSPSDALLRATLEKNRISALRLAAVSWAKRGELEKSFSFIQKMERSKTLTKEAQEAAVKERKRIIHLVGDKRINELDYLGAAAVYRQGLVYFPSDATARHNLLAVLERVVLPMIKDGRCVEAEPHLSEITQIDPRNSFAATAKAKCLSQQARDRLKTNDYSSAVELLRAAHALMPKESSIRHNLAVALYRWAEERVRAGSCRDARARVKEIRALGTTKFNRFQLSAVLKGCGG